MLTEEKRRNRVLASESVGPLVLALDIGTSSVRAALYDAEAREVEGFEARVERGLTVTAEGGSELEFEKGIRDVYAAIDALFLRQPVPPHPIVAVGISAFWHSLIGADSEMRAVTPVYGWADTRAASEAAELRQLPDSEVFYQRTGARFHPSYWPAKILWLKKTYPEKTESVRYWLSFSDLLLHRFCGSALTSISMASGTGLLNRFTCEWDGELASTIGVPLKQLPEIDSGISSPRFLVPVLASRWPQLSEAKWLPAIGDGAANNVGAGCISNDRLALMIGTSGAMRVLFDGEPPAELRAGLWCYRLDNMHPVVGGALSDGGGLFAWMLRSLNVGADGMEIENQLAEIRPDQHGLTVLPFWSGERSTGWHEDARGAVLGLRSHTRPIEIVRASMEAVAYRFALIADALGSFAKPTKIVASGGALNASKVWTQILADVMGRPVVLSNVNEASSRGAAIFALRSIGALSGLKGADIDGDPQFKPDDEAHKIYKKALARQEEFYGQLIEDRDR